MSNMSNKHPHTSLRLAGVIASQMKDIDFEWPETRQCHGTGHFISNDITTAGSRYMLKILTTMSDLKALRESFVVL